MPAAVQGLEEGRLALRKWGFRRCEDIVWAKTNKLNPVCLPLSLSLCLSC
jgi:hypothetical protein